MTNEEILEKQVEALEKLLQLKQAVLQELEAKIARMEAEKFSYPGLGIPQYPQQPQYPGYPGWYTPVPQNPLITPPIVSIPSVWTVDPCPGNPGGTHDYPIVTNTTGPHACRHCGKQVSLTITTVANNNADLQVHTSGYVQPVEPDNVFTLQSAVK